MGKYLVTYDVDYDNTRNELRNRIVKDNQNVELSETCFLVKSNNIKELYKDLSFNKDKDRFVILDLDNTKRVDHDIECKTTILKDKIDKFFCKIIEFTDFIKNNNR